MKCQTLLLISELVSLSASYNILSWQLVVKTNILHHWSVWQDTQNHFHMSNNDHKKRNHYENTPIQIYRHFHLLKLKIFRCKNSDIFHMSAQNIDCGYSLEPPRRGGSNEYPQSMFLSRNKKIIYTPVNPSFTIWKWGLRGSTLYRHVFVMEPKYCSLIW